MKIVVDRNGTYVILKTGTNLRTSPSTVLTSNIGGYMKTRYLLTGVFAVLFFLSASTAHAKKPPKPPEPQPPDASPAVEAVTPSSATVSVGAFTSFTCVYSDADGWQDLASAELIIDTTTNRRQCCYVRYDQNSGKIYLRNDNNKAWLGGYSPGSANVIENSQAVLDCSQSSVSGSGTGLSLTWSLAFKGTFSGAKKIFLYVEDDSGASQGWLSMGTCDIVASPPDTTPPTGMVSVNEGAPYVNTLAVTLILSAQDEAGGSGVSLMCFSDDGVAWSDPEAYATSKSWVLPAGDGTKAVYARFADAAGNWSGACPDTIVLDTVPPQIDITSPQEGEVIGG